jgi:hypothetical protein
MERAEVEAIFNRWLDGLNRGGDPDQEYEDHHRDCVIEFPQSGEAFDRDGLLGMQREYPGGSPQAKFVRLTGHGDEWTLEATVDYGREREGVWPVVVTCEFKGGKIIRDTRYFAEPFEAPEGRAKWTKDGSG